jgi:hypothetical protein
MTDADFDDDFVQWPIGPESHPFMLSRLHRVPLLGFLARRINLCDGSVSTRYYADATPEQLSEFRYALELGSAPPWRWMWSRMLSVAQRFPGAFVLVPQSLANVGGKRLRVPSTYPWFRRVWSTTCCHIAPIGPSNEESVFEVLRFSSQFTCECVICSGPSIPPEAPLVDELDCGVLEAWFQNVVMMVFDVYDGDSYLVWERETARNSPQPVDGGPDRASGIVVNTDPSVLPELPAVNDLSRIPRRDDGWSLVHSASMFTRTVSGGREFLRAHDFSSEDDTAIARYWDWRAADGSRWRIFPHCGAQLVRDGTVADSLRAKTWRDRVACNDYVEHAIIEFFEEKLLKHFSWHGLESHGRYYTLLPKGVSVEPLFEGKCLERALPWNAIIPWRWVLGSLSQFLVGNEGLCVFLEAVSQPDPSTPGLVLSGLDGTTDCPWVCRYVGERRYLFLALDRVDVSSVSRMDRHVVMKYWKLCVAVQPKWLDFGVTEDSVGYPQIAQLMESVVWEAREIHDGESYLVWQAEESEGRGQG